MFLATYDILLIGHFATAEGLHVPHDSLDAGSFFKKP